MIAAQRIESLPPRPFDVVSARALAPLDRLCGLARRFAGPGTVFLFPKGARLDSELTAAARHWHIGAERIASRTDPQATVLRMTELEPRS
jgi:16S rRNA (guanine527-N7)-methyltransferase